MKSLLPALFLAIGCSQPAPPEHVPAVLRTWDLPPGAAPRLVASLDRVLRDQGDATEGPGGSLVVVGPATVVAGVDAVVKRVVDGPPPPPPSNVDLRWWFVRGEPAAETTRGPGLEALSATLDTLVATDGPMALSLVATRDLRTLDGQQGQIEDQDLKLTQIASIEPTSRTVIADVEVGVGPAAEVRTRLALKDGTVAVLSQTGGAGSLYILVRPEIIGVR
ncbi:MAG: hypothetical protein H6738_13165 [Alphaproteobacteria bacterium]|nr:hypothetical protein [Alphaproteobacteria bacterium]MCB9697726.1 hypothetical protein [Alphaproteobacteria bacterium]